jgi:16S rRNA (cytidine1402-2'-O)-methyltransferase
LLYLTNNSIIVKGKLYLLPVTLGGPEYSRVIPEAVLSLTRELRFFIVEDIRSARRYLRLIDKKFPIDDTTFFELNEHTADSEISQFLDPIMKGSDCGVMSEAGLPGIADPGARIVALAHKKRIDVRPQSGPSSILLALISSGLNGQQFCFNGYLPVKPAERASKIKDLERRASEGFSQIFMETPYRVQKMADTLLSVCHPYTLLCIASDISLDSESIRTMEISEWRLSPPELNGRLVIFILK